MAAKASYTTILPATLGEVAIRALGAGVVEAIVAHSTAAGFLTFNDGDGSGHSDVRKLIVPLQAGVPTVLTHLSLGFQFGVRVSPSSDNAASVAPTAPITLSVVLD